MKSVFSTGGTGPHLGSLTVTRRPGSLPAIRPLILSVSIARHVSPRLHAAALAAYVVLTLAFSWPLPIHLGTHLTGPPGGDTGVYVWNQWVFRHELVDRHQMPLFTGEIFSLTPPANLSLHNYTIFQDLIALPLLGVLGVVTTFNLVYLLMVVLTGYAMFLLAWHVTGRPVESWLAGALFSWCPWLATRGIGHFSLVAAAPLPIFALLLLRLEERGRLLDAFALGVTVCWAATTDPYYAVYCVMMACLFLAMRTVRVTHDAKQSSAPRTLDALIACVAGFAASLLIGGGWQVTILGRSLRAHGLYTPMLVLTVLVLIRVAWPYRRAALSIDRAQLLRLARAASVAALVSAVLLSPVLYAVSMRIRDSGFESSNILWRSSTPGVDLVSFFLPNPNHVLAPAAIRDWLSPRADLYLENVASLPFVALLTVIAAVRTGWRAPRFWMVLTIAFALLALGPFVHVAGVNTDIPGPWAIARYLPLVRLARAPARLTIVALLGLSMLFACALSHFADRWPGRRRLLLAAVTVVMAFELLPAPRPLYSAAIPRFYQRVAASPDDVRVLELPVGIRDGTSSIGSFSARSQFFQTVHGKPLIGGYLSRVSRRRIAEIRQDPMLDALITLSEGGTLDAARERELTSHGQEFIRRARVGFVVIDTSQASPYLRDLAVRTLRLRRIDSEDPYELYVPVSD